MRSTQRNPIFVSLIKNQTPDSLTTMASPLLPVHVFNSSKHEKMWLWLGESVHCKQHHSSHSPWGAPCSYRCQGLLSASTCKLRPEEGAGECETPGTVGKCWEVHGLQPISGGSWWINTAAFSLQMEKLRDVFHVIFQSSPVGLSPSCPH